MTRPLLLDLFCGAGGCSVGYHRAGFDVVGVDLNPQPQYPFHFIRADAFAFVAEHGWEYDAIHASPPCQAHTAMRRLGKNAGAGAVDLIPQTRASLASSGKPYVIENVVGAPLRSPLILCGSTFGLGVRRHRLFESNVDLGPRPSCRHKDVPRPIAVYGDHPQSPGDKTYRVNRARTLAEGQAAMGIDWMPWRPLTQAIPPAFTEYVGLRLRLCRLIRTELEKAA
jgi:DNA (cytosine-5)-methyltransferase 1